MSEIYVPLSFMVLFGIQIIISELEKRRATKREANLIQMVKSLQNRISAGDLGSFMALEEQEKPSQNPLRVTPSSDEMLEGLPYGMNGGM